MANRKFQNLADSGEITDIKIGGTTARDSVATQGSIDDTNTQVDKNTAITSQTQISSSVTLSSFAGVYFVDATAGNITIALPNSSDGRQGNIKRIDSSSNTVNVTSSDGIDSVFSINLSSMDNVSLVSNLTKYYIL